MNPILAVVTFILARMREPSTHAGIAAVLMALAPMFPAYAGILQAIAVAFGGVAVAKPDAPRDQGPSW